MKRLILVTWLISGCSSNHDSTSSTNEVENIVKEYYNALKQQNFAIMRRLTTEDFTLFENGQYFNNDSVVNYFKSSPKFSVDYKFDNFSTKVDNHLASSTYIKTAKFIINDTSRLTIHTRETAVLKDLNRRWVLMHLHTSQIP